MKMRYDLEIRDKDGKLISHAKRSSHSFVRNWIRMLRTIILGVHNYSNNSVTLTNTSGGSTTFQATWTGSHRQTILGMNAPTNNADYGIIVGTSDLAFDKTHYNLQGKIAHGSGVGQLLYGAMTIDDYTEADTQARVRMTRTFTNNTGSTVTVKEIGIAICNVNEGVPVTQYYLACRDVLVSPQAIPDGATLTVRYTLYYSY